MILLELKRLPHLTGTQKIKSKYSVLLCNQIRMFSRVQTVCSVLLRPKSNVLSSQRIKSNVLCFFAQIQMFYLLKGSNPISCASLHQFKNVSSSQRIKANIMCFFAPIQKCSVSSKIKSNVLLCTKFKFSVFSLRIEFTNLAVLSKLYHSLPILFQRYLNCTTVS